MKQREKHFSKATPQGTLPRVVEVDGLRVCVWEIETQGPEGPHFSVHLTVIGLEEERAVVDARSRAELDGLIGNAVFGFAASVRLRSRQRA